MKEIQDYEKYYVPKVVSVGPHHFGNPKFELVENLKPIFIMRLVADDKETLKSLYKKLGEPNMVQDLRNFYEENSTVEFNANEFTKMMLLDGCFILYYIVNIFGGKFESCRELKSQQIVYIYEDLFLLENQIPYEVLDDIMNVAKIDYRMMIKLFTDDNILAHGRQKKKWFELILGVRNDESSSEESRLDINNVDHLLHLLRSSLTKIVKAPKSDFSVNQTYSRTTSRNVNELMDAGIHFKPNGTMSLTHIEFVRGWRSGGGVEQP